MKINQMNGKKYVYHMDGLGIQNAWRLFSPIFQVWSAIWVQVPPSWIFWFLGTTTTDPRWFDGWNFGFQQKKHGAIFTLEKKDEHT